MFELYKTDSGIDEWDSKTWIVAYFTTKEKALDYLKEKGYTFCEYPTVFPNIYKYKEEKLRYGMGTISYTIKGQDVKVATNPTARYKEPSYYEVKRLMGEVN